MPKKLLYTDASSTVTTPSLVKKLSVDFPEITFTSHPSACAWNPSKAQILYGESTDPDELLHEVGHAILGHSSYARDIELLRIERDAWEYAIANLAPIYKIVIERDVAEAALDTYREWLHERSKCPSCNMNGIQNSATSYKCISCHEHWKVNDARICRLRRTRITNK